MKAIIKLELERVRTNLGLHDCHACVLNSKRCDQIESKCLADHHFRLITVKAKKAEDEE